MNGDFKKAADEIIENARKAVSSTDDSKLEKIMGEIVKSKSIFVAGAGRSGLVMKAFAMRLMHLDMPVYVVGETITPVIKKDDLLIILSGSGETNSAVTVTEVAKKSGANIILFTSRPDSTMGKMADILLKVHGRSKDDVKSYTKRQMDADAVKKSVNPMGTLFETSSLIILDSIIYCLMRRTGKSEWEMKAKHSKTH